MKNEITTDINSFSEMIAAKGLLKNEIGKQEVAFRDNSIFKIASSLILNRPSSGNPYKKPLSFKADEIRSSISNVNVKSATENILGTLLFANRTTRKYFVMFTIAKEMIPFTIKKVSEILNKK